MGLEKEGLMERHEAGKWTDRMFKITDGKLTFSTVVKKVFFTYPLSFYLCWLRYFVVLFAPLFVCSVCSVCFPVPHYSP